MVTGRWTSGPAGVGVVAPLIVAASLAPDPVVLGAVLLAAFAVAVAGASLLVVRAGAADLATAAIMAAGAYAGGVGTALLGVPVGVGLPAGAAVGAVIGGASGALHGRVGRALGALTSLALGLAVVAVLGAWPAGGGVAGFHAVGLPTPAGDRIDLLATGAVLVVVLTVAWRVAGARLAAAAGVAVRAPAVAASFGRRPAGDMARLGALAGALVGVGGVALAAVDGSVVPGAYGLDLAAALALAALVGGAPPLGPVIGTLLLWGPGTVWPLVPLVGTAPPLLVMGPVGLAVLAWRRGRPLVAGTVAPASVPVAADDAAPLPPARPVTLDVTGADTPTGTIDLRAEPGEVVAVIGPNGAGKSTLLARIGGQLPDHGSVRIGGHRLPARPAVRARAGVARTWQRPPRLPAADALAVVVGGRPERAAAAGWAAALLDGASDEGGRDQLIRLAAGGPALALLDEPTDLAPDVLLAFLRGLAGAGTTVVVVDHRPEVAAGADRVVTVGSTQVRP